MEDSRDEEWWGDGGEFVGKCCCDDDDNDDDAHSESGHFFKCKNQRLDECIDNGKRFCCEK